MNRTVSSTLLISLLLIGTGFAGGTAREVTVTSVETGKSGSLVLRFTEAEVGARTLHIRYNAARMRGVVSLEEHQTALAHLRASIARHATITLGNIGGNDFVRVPGTKSEFASDALQLMKGVVYAWPTKR